ncbi:sulfur carrier protein ThiS [Desulfatiferula olefinivorans]
MRICVNGEYEDLDEGPSLLDYLAARNLSPSEVVVERNLLIVMKDDYATVRLMDGDTLEILRFVGGG